MGIQLFHEGKATESMLFEQLSGWKSADSAMGSSLVVAPKAPGKPPRSFTTDESEEIASAMTEASAALKEQGSKAAPPSLGTVSRASISSDASSSEGPEKKSVRRRMSISSNSDTAATG